MKILDGLRQRWRGWWARVRPKLIDGVEDAWRLWSVRLGAAGSLLSGFFLAWPDVAMSVWNGLPPEVRAALPDRVEMVVPTALFVAVTIARVIKQEPKK